MQSQKLDLSSFKRDINLVTYAALHDYRIDKKKSTKTSIAMKSGNDKVIITKKGGNWVYFSVGNDQDSGTIVDFVLNRTSKSISEVARLLADWSGLGAVPSPVFHVDEAKPDRSRVQAIFAKCQPATTHNYLASRGLGSEVLNSPRFARRVFVDRYGNAVFPHYSSGKICGLELKNAERGMLVKGSRKTFWRSNTRASDTTVVITESVIDALSYQQVFKPSDCFYLATGGGVSSTQCRMLVQLLESKASIEKVTVATDNDQGGDRIGRRIFEAVDQSLYNGKIVRRRPKQKGTDWNDLLMTK